jgi:hypothetical protein
LARRRLVSSIALAIDGVMVSAYMCTWPDTLRAARPMVWMRLVPLRRKPSLSASRIGHQADLGQVEPLAQQVDADQHVVVPLPQLLEQLDAPDGVDLGVQVADPDAELEQVVGEVLDIFLVSVVTRTRSSFSARTRISCTRSSIWPLVGLTTISGSTRPVGRMTCSTTSLRTRLSS